MRNLEKSLRKKSSNAKNSRTQFTNSRNASQSWKGGRRKGPRRIDRMFNTRLGLVTSHRCTAGTMNQATSVASRRNPRFPNTPPPPPNEGRHRVSPEATWQRAICYFALSATRSLINLVALFAGRSACFIPRSGPVTCRPTDSSIAFFFPCLRFSSAPSASAIDRTRTSAIRNATCKRKVGFRVRLLISCFPWFSVLWIPCCRENV